MGAVVVTGAAGFIGSHLVDRLLADGREVIGIDNLDAWYSQEQKQRNLASARRHPRYREWILDLARLPGPDLRQLLHGAETVYHLAGRPGVQDSWGHGFEETCDQNILLTQRVAEAATEAGAGRLVLASSSSVYGSSAATGERIIDPISPYGASKVASEHVAGVYGHRGLPVVALRYFTVFGPRQRPDMAFHRLLQACLGGPPFQRRGTGVRRREFTFVDDVVSATVAAGTAPVERIDGRSFDVGGGCVTSLDEVIDRIERLAGRSVNLITAPACHGDPTMTAADIETTAAALHWRPTVSLERGLAQQWDWHRAEAGHGATPCRSSGRADLQPIHALPANTMAHNTVNTASAVASRA